MMDVVGEPKRRAILDILGRSGERSVTEISDHFDVTRSAVSQHLAILLDAGLVVERKDGRRRLYSLHPDGGARIRAAVAEFWHGELDSLGNDAEHEAARERTTDG